MSGINKIAARPLLPNRPRLRFVEGAPEGAAPAAPATPATPTAPTPAAPQAPAPKDAEFKPISSQEELDKALGARLAREREKFADYDDLKTKAQKYAEVEESQKTELQKAADRATAAETTAAEKASALLRYEVAADKKITGEDLAFLTAGTKEDLEAQADRVIALRAAAGPVVPKPDPSIGPKAPAKPSGLGAAITAHYSS